MAIDYTGMFTGERPNPSAGVAGMPRDLLGQTLQGIDQGEQRSRQALGQMMGKDLRSSADQAREQLSQVDIKSVNTPEGMLKLAQLKQAMGDTGAAMTLASQAQMMRGEQAAKAQKSQGREGFANYLEKTYPSKGYGEMARQGVITPANMKEFIAGKSDKARRTEVIPTVIDGVPTQALIDLDNGGVIAEFNPSRDTVSDEDDTFEKKIRNAEGELEWVSYRRQKNGPPIKIGVLGPAENIVLKDKELLRVESVGDDGQSYLKVYDLNSTDKTPLFEARTDTNRVLTEKVDTATGQTIKISTLPDGSEGVSYGVTKLPTFDIVLNDNGTYNVINETLGRLVLENVATVASAEALVKERTNIQKTLTEIDRQIGFISEADDLIANNSARWDAMNYATLYPLMKYVGGSTAKQLEAKNESIISAIGMDKLVDLKESSSVGASGLGALNVKELQMLQDALGRLDPAVGDVAYRKQLAEVKRHYGNFRSTLMGQTPPIDWSNPAYSDFTKTVTVNGQPRTYYKLSNSAGQPLTTADGSIQWFPAPARQPARK